MALDVDLLTAVEELPGDELVDLARGLRVLERLVGDRTRSRIDEIERADRIRHGLELHDLDPDEDDPELAVLWQCKQLAEETIAEMMDELVADMEAEGFSFSDDESLGESHLQDPGEPRGA